MSATAFAAIIFGLATAIAWGVADFFAAKASKKFGGLATGVMVTVIGALVFDVVFLLFFRSHVMWNAAGWGFATVSALAFTAANLSFYKGLEYGPVSIVSPLGSMYPLVTTLLLVAFFGNQLNVRQAVGIGVVMLGVAAASGLFDRAKKNGRKIGRGPLLGICGALFWGIAWTCIAQAVEHIGWQLTAVIELTLSSLCFVPLLSFLNRTEPGLIKNLVPSLKNVIMVTAAVLMMIGFLSLSLGIEMVGDLATTAVVISACYPLITVFLALRKLNEAFDPIPLAGALTGIIGVVILSLG